MSRMVKDAILFKMFNNSIINYYFSHFDNRKGMSKIAVHRLVPRECQDKPNTCQSRRIFQNASSCIEITLESRKRGPKKSVMSNIEPNGIITDSVDAALEQGDLSKRLDGVVLFLENLKVKNNDDQSFKRLLGNLTDTVNDAKIVISSQSDRFNQLEYENNGLKNEVRLLKKKVADQKLELTKRHSQLQRFIKLCREMQLSIVTFIGLEPENGID
ncbi:uncharacterized protein LOC136029414 isoform X2 [Artemia franciscana]